MTIEEFEERARAAFESIPLRFRERVDGPHVEPAAKEHEHVPGTFVLGECVHHPDWTGETPLHSSVFLYHGSFLALAARDPSFDLDAEIVETVLHEVQHHVEDSAGADRLRDLDWAEDQNGLRLEGLPHAARFWRAGTHLGAGLYRVGPDLFLEIPLRRAAWDAARRDGLEIDVLGERLTVPAEDVPEPADGATVIYDWDWTDVPDDARNRHGHDHGHGHGQGCETETWGDLVIRFELRRLPSLPGSSRVVP